jgi:hypothetical protein
VPRYGTSFSIRFLLGKPEEFGSPLCQRLDQLHLAKQRADDEDRRHATDFRCDMRPGPAPGTLDVEDLLSQLLAAHVNVL